MMILKIEKYWPEIIGSLICLTLGMLSGYSVNAADSLWYAALKKPIFTPPNWVFGPVWTLLYLMMGVAMGILWKDKSKNKRLILIFTLQLILNLLWSPLFFYYHNIGGALLDICALWIALICLIFFARGQQIILFLMLPYVVWITFAALINFNIYQMN